MNVFLAGIIQGSLTEAKINAQNWRDPIKAAFDRHVPQADVYCHYSEHPNSITYELSDIRETLTDGIERAANCDLLVAYVPSASMGTAIEMYEARRGGAAIVTISPMIANWVIRAYSDRILTKLEDFELFVASGELKRLVQEKRS